MSDSSNPMGCSLPGPSIHGIFQARVLEWGDITFSCPHYFMATKGENVEVVADFLFLGSKITVDGDWSHEIRR